MRLQSVQSGRFFVARYPEEQSMADPLGLTYAAGFHGKPAGI